MLWAVNERIPCFFAAGHFTMLDMVYCTVRSMQRLHGEVLERFLKGEHVQCHSQDCGTVYGQTCS